MLTISFTKRSQTRANFTRVQQEQQEQQQEQQTSLLPIQTRIFGVE